MVHVVILTPAVLHRRDSDPGATYLPFNDALVVNIDEAFETACVEDVDDVRDLG